MWLDEIAAATQHLQYPAVGGFQPPVVVTSLNMEPQTHEFVNLIDETTHCKIKSLDGQNKNVVYPVRMLYIAVT